MRNKLFVIGSPIEQSKSPEVMKDFINRDGLAKSFVFSYEELSTSEFFISMVSAAPVVNPLKTPEMISYSSASLRALEAIDFGLLSKRILSM